MMYRFLLLFLCIGVNPMLCSAQQGVDSAYFFYQDRQAAESYVLSPVNGKVQSRESYGLLKLNHDISSGGFRRAQQAYKRSETSFEAIGFNRLGKFHLGGYFTFNMIEDDSLASSLRNDLEDLSAFYAYANKSSHYKRQNYTVDATLSYQLSKVLMPFLRVHYQKHWSAGTVDPRLTADRFTLKVKPGVAAKLGNHIVGAYALLGKADEKISLGYKNLNYQNSTSYLDRIHYMNYGYGSVVIKDTASVFKYDSYKGGGINYASTMKGWQLQLAGEYVLLHNTNQTSERGTRYDIGPTGVFDLSTLTFSLSAYGPVRNGTQQSFFAKAISNSGQDGNLKTSGSLTLVNYRVATQATEFSYFFLWHKQRALTKELGLNVSYSSILRRDLLQSATLDAANTQITAFINAYLKGKNGGDMKFSAQPYYSVPKRTAYSYNPLSEKSFIQNIALVDYYYYASKYWGAKIDGEYIGRFFGKNDLGFFASIDYRKSSVPSLMEGVPPAFVPQGKRVDARIGVRLYLNGN